MIFKQFYLKCLSHASYAIGDQSSGLAAVVDPQRDVDQYLAWAKDHQLQIKWVILTHFHADFLSGHLELQAECGAQICLGQAAEADYDFLALGDGQSLSIGEVRLEFLETPGHTPESISVLVFDKKNSTEPHAVLSGDALFIGDVGRPDLMASQGQSADDLAGMLYDSLHKKLMALPDSTLLYPAHGAGSMCGKNLSTDTVSSIGKQRDENVALQTESRQDFVTMVTKDQPPAPAYFAYDASLNRKQRNTLGQSMAQSLKKLSWSQFDALRQQGALVLDTRSADDFARQHLKGSLTIGLDGRFASWTGCLLKPQQDLLLLTAPGQEQESVMRLGRIGFDQVLGILDQGLADSDIPAEMLGSMPRWDALELQAEIMKKESPLRVLDVRGPGERAQSKIKGSEFIPLPELATRHSELDRQQAWVLCCAGGYRSAAAASLLLKLGFNDVSDLRGGMQAWQGAGCVAE